MKKNITSGPGVLNIKKGVMSPSELDNFSQHQLQLQLYAFSFVCVEQTYV